MVDFAEIPGVPCPCGTARRAFADVPEFPATFHVTDISADAALHYHKRLTEVYYFLECGPGARMQLDDEVREVKPGMCILIPPGVAHGYKVVGPGEALLVYLTDRFYNPEDEGRIAYDD